MTLSPVYLKFAPALKGREGGAQFTNRPADRGGPTRWGVTAKKLGEWRKLGRVATADEVRNLTEGEADQIYSTEFFVEPGFDKIASMSGRIAEELLDTGVNMGTYYPCTWLQRGLNLMNRQGRDFPDVLVDGELGPKSREALSALVRLRGQTAAEDLVLKTLNGFQFMRYVGIAEGGGPNNDQEQNFVGWVAQRIGF